MTLHEKALELGLYQYVNESDEQFSYRVLIVYAAKTKRSKQLWFAMRFGLAATLALFGIVSP